MGLEIYSSKGEQRKVGSHLYSDDLKISFQESSSIFPSVLSPVEVKPTTCKVLVRPYTICRLTNVLLSS